MFDLLHLACWPKWFRFLGVGLFTNGPDHSKILMLKAPFCRLNMSRQRWIHIGSICVDAAQMTTIKLLHNLSNYWRKLSLNISIVGDNRILWQIGFEISSICVEAARISTKTTSYIIRRLKSTSLTELIWNWLCLVQISWRYWRFCNVLLSCILSGKLYTHRVSVK